ncbi:MAG: SIS domain-containing protein, partial [Candidatus Aenigmarchaeota archaeon]|nr:SIS domain-containing protein [Candidatus Aenigmarchaeota archaeon]
MCLFKKNSKKSIDSKDMKQEIEDQGLAIELTIEKELENIKKVSNKVKKCKNFIFSGCGDKYIVPLTSEYLWRNISKKPLDVIQSWTLKNYPPKYLDEDTCIVFVSQSGTTYDTVEACQLAIEKNCNIVALTNLREKKEGSLIDLCENYGKGSVMKMHTKNYPERSLPSTGSFHSSLTALNLFTLFANGKSEELLYLQTKHVPKLVNMLSNSEEIKIWSKEKSKQFRKFNNFYVVGDGSRSTIARKQAKIMMMEGVKTNACDVEGEEFVHSLIETLEYKSNPLILLKPLIYWKESFRLFRMIKKFWEKYAGENEIIIIDPFEYLDAKSKQLFSGIEGNILSPFLYAPQLEWLSYYLALEKGKDPSIGTLVKKIRSE